MRFKASWIVIIAGIVSLALFQTSCKKTKTLNTGGIINFSVDTLKFDTLFTAAGSYTNWVVIHNPQNETVTLSSVRLAGGTSSYFRLNVDGFQGNDITNLKIAAHDSIYVFATVKIDPDNTLTPFFVEEKIIATLNGKEFSLPVTAYGQNAHYIVNDSITVNTTWLTDKPYVVIGACVIGPGTTGSLPPTLTIPSGCKVYMHQNARLFVYGWLLVNPTGKDSVVFQGDRLDRAYFGYKGYPGEWGGIYVVNQGQAYISNTIIKNCGGSTKYYEYGIQPAAVEVDKGGKLWMYNTVIKNSIGYGILGYQGDINATNCLVHTCGASAFGVIQGGHDTMTNCTFANYSTGEVTHTNNPTVGILNYLPIGNGQIEKGDLNTVMTNCIVYGSLDSEFYCDAAGGGDANLLLDHCLIGTGWQLPSFLKTKDCIIGQAATGFIDPKFVSTSMGNFAIDGSSPAVGKGLVIPGLKDINGKDRGAANDIGCYQH